ncbi:hypothetical protein Taro_020571 [Colocasia esculenta]|uniref:Uncharacterized protein n=1 Tax=Colocasia esculenta TaxID=4460 RepID=A0A843V2I5_COLES|nr:hypothetical protein [Colocasia esculenta]
MAPIAAALSLSVPSALSLSSGHSTLVASHPRLATLRFRAPPAGTALIRCAASSLNSSKGAAVLEKPSNPTKTGNWLWKFQEYSANIYYEEHGEDTENTKTILMIPTISDVSTVEEWRVVAKDIVAREGKTNWHAILVDWPGLGYSDRPSINYNADVMENFLVQLLSAPNSPLHNSGNTTKPKNLPMSSSAPRKLLLEMSSFFRSGCFPDSNHPNALAGWCVLPMNLISWFNVFTASSIGPPAEAHSQQVIEG